MENVKGFVYLGQVITTENDGCFTEHRVARATAKFNELRTVLKDKRVNLRTHRKLLEACVRSRLTFGTQACFPNARQLKKLEVCWMQCMRAMIRGGWEWKETPDDADEVNSSFIYTNADIQRIMKKSTLSNSIYVQRLKYISHIFRLPNTSNTMKMLFAKPTRKYVHDPWLKIAELLGVSVDQAKKLTQSRRKFIEVV